MKKQDLLRAARIMYDLQEDCAFKFWEFEEPCKECAANKGDDVCDLFVACHGIPQMWGITKADIERLEKEANLEKGIAAIEELAESPEEKII